MISTLIIAKGNPPYLFETIDSVKQLADEIIVVDIGLSADVSNKLQKMGVRVKKIGENVPYVEQIRERTKSFAKNKYILFLDPDEIIQPTLSKKLSEVYMQYDYISIPRKNIIFGKWIQHAKWWPDYQTRLFKKDQATWPTKIHKQPHLTGNGLTLKSEEQNAITHHNYKNIDEYFSKMVRYAKSEAHFMTENKQMFSLHEALVKGIGEFISRFFASDGYKDGMHGFVLSFLQMMYYPLVYFYVWEEKKHESHDDVVEESHFFFKQGLFETTHWLTKKQLKKLNALKTKLQSFITKP
ncbi:glycosyltransferase family 2 protein [Candidatus Woesebacteria bacterium]|nr:glycosyltransferase family 2 protein [Candidatus Woesebacteria bacterium]